MLKLFIETQRKFLQENRLQETLHELSSLEKCKIEEDSQMEEEDGGMEEEEDDDDDDDGEELIAQEMECSDRGWCDYYLNLKPFSTHRVCAITHTMAFSPFLFLPESDEEDNEHKSIGRVKRTNVKV